MAIYRGVGGSGESTTNTLANLVAQYTFDAEAAKIAAQAAQAASEAAKVVAEDASASALADSLIAGTAADEASESAAEAAASAEAAATFDPDDFVNLTSNQTVAGVKTFSSTIVGSINGNAATATNVAYSGLTGTVPTWNQDTTGNAATVTNGVYLATTQTLTNKTLDGGTY